MLPPINLRKVDYYKAKARTVVRAFAVSWSSAYRRSHHVFGTVPSAWAFAVKNTIVP